MALRTGRIITIIIAATLGEAMFFEEGIRIHVMCDKHIL